jgi:PAS domain S-box-containing protein
MEKYRKSIPVFIGIIFIGIIIWAWTSYNDLNKRISITEISIIEEQTALKIEDCFKIRITAIKQLTNQLSLLEEFNKKHFIENAKLYYKNYEGFQAINWINKSGIIKYVHPLAGNEKALNIDLHKHSDIEFRRIFLKSEKSQDINISSVINLQQGGYGIIMDSPLYINKKFSGYVNAVFNIEEFIGTSINENMSKIYNIYVLQGDNLLYCNSKHQLNESLEKNQGAIFKLHDNIFKLHITKQYNRSYSNIFINLVFIMGIVLSLSLILFTYLLMDRIALHKKATKEIYEMYKVLDTSQYEKNEIIKNNPDAICSLGINGNIISANEAFLRITEYREEEIEGENIYNLIVEEYRGEFKKVIDNILATGKPSKQNEFVFITKTKQRLNLEINTIPILKDKCVSSFWIFSRDLTEFNKLQRQVYQANKMEALGKLSNGIAHDFNNLLTGVVGYSDLILRKSFEESKVKNYANIIKNTGLKAKRLIGDLMVFSRKQKLETSIFDINKLIREEHEMLEQIICDEIELKISLDKSPCIIKGDKVKIQNVILNLIVNAKDAISGSGHILIKTEHSFNHKFINRVVNSKNMKCVKVTVSDNGSGMTKDMIDNIFDPFFTTKVKGEGTGLGLSIVYGTVKQHEGEIKVASAIGEGTDINIYIPESLTDTIRIKEKHQEEIYYGKGNVLLVDDYEESLLVTKMMLENLGYSVTISNSGEEAIKKFYKAKGDFKIIITDEIMQNLRGHEMIKILQEKQDIKTLIISGYIGENKEINDMGLILLKKPFTIEELSKQVYEIINGNGN